MSELYWIQLQNVPIWEQLQLEEALLRADMRNICLINIGSPRAIVMGISGEPAQLLDIAAVSRDQVPVIKRFSGGGTVIVDEKTLFISFLFQKEAIPISPYPEPLLRWSADLYQQSWQIPHFALQENDYAIGQRKCGGNAQYIRKERWLHHTSFLWDYADANMDYLLLPPKRPKYRSDRTHGEFLCRLKELAASPEQLAQQLKQELAKRFTIQNLSPSSLSFPPHRQMTQRIPL